MIIEFLGTPGTGKSYLTKKIESIFLYHGVEVSITNESYFNNGNKAVRRLKKIGFVIVLLFKKPSVLKLIKAILSEDIAFEQKITTVYNSLAVVAANNISPTTLTIRDEGIFQVLFSIHILCNQSIEYYFNLLSDYINIPDLVISIRSKKSVEQNIIEQGRGGRIFRYISEGILTERDLKESAREVEEFLAQKGIQSFTFSYSKTNDEAATIIKTITDFVLKKLNTI